MGWLKVLKTVVELIPIIGNILAIFGRKKAEKQAKKIANVATAVVIGVEKYTDAKKNGTQPNVKEIIKETAISLGAEEALKKLVIKLTK